MTLTEANSKGMPIKRKITNFVQPCSEDPDLTEGHEFQKIKQRGQEL